jgi:4'-phosphopantetheinyl transferase
MQNTCSTAKATRPFPAPDWAPRSSPIIVTVSHRFAATPGTAAITRTNGRRSMADEAHMWAAPSSKCGIGPGEVHVWRIGLAQPEHVTQSHRACLEESERNRADRYYFDRDRNRFTIARGALRQLLGSHLNVDPREVRFVYGPQGKPALEAPLSSSGLRFNLSHSGEVALLALAHNVELGIDVEQIRPDFASGEIAARFFSPEECARLDALPAGHRVDAFFNCWTRKEAYIKARGKGLSIPLDSFTVAFAPGEQPALLHVKTGDDLPSRWRFHELHPGPGYKAALAVEGNDHRLLLWQWQGEPGISPPPGL